MGRRENRDKAPDLFEQELTTAITLLAASPEAFPVWGQRRERVIRRCLLQKARTHLYFFVDDATDQVVVVSAWGAAQGRKPQLLLRFESRWEIASVSTIMPEYRLGVFPALDRSSRSCPITSGVASTTTLTGTA